MINDVELEAILEMEKKAAHPPWTKPAESTSGRGYCLDASGPFGPERIAVENRYTAAFICAMRNMWPLLIEERKRYVDNLKAFDVARKIELDDRLEKLQSAREVANRHIADSCKIRMSLDPANILRAWPAGFTPPTEAELWFALRGVGAIP